ncbi:MAG TPA: flagellar assembly protein FliW [Candidatus Polarisedimenticolia bacterium]|nr:flagellar assembly protein FliW [Candidatus Polarisedimenticolia bacterium]
MDAARVPQEVDTTIHFEEGILGVPRARRFLLLEKEGSPLRLLRCLDIEGFVLPVTDPALADPNYRPALDARVTAAIDLEQGDPLLVLAVTTLGAEGPTANLRAPVVINVRRRVGAQVILEDHSYSLRAPIKL